MNRWPATGLSAHDSGLHSSSAMPGYASKARRTLRRETLATLACAGRAPADGNKTNGQQRGRDEKGGLGRARPLLPAIAVEQVEAPCGPLLPPRREPGIARASPWTLVGEYPA